MTDYLNIDFIRGYTKAIQDTQCIFEYAQDEMRCRRMSLNYKLSMQLLKCILDNRMYLREQIHCKNADRRAPFIRWNNVKKDFEYYDPKKAVIK